MIELTVNRADGMVFYRWHEWTQGKTLQTTYHLDGTNRMTYILTVDQLNLFRSELQNDLRRPGNTLFDVWNRPYAKAAGTERTGRRYWNHESVLKCLGTTTTD